MSEPFAIAFAVVYGLGLVFFAILILRFRARQPIVEQQIGPLPAPPAIISWLIPPVLLLTGFGVLSVDLVAIRALGVGLALYALIVMPWAAAVLGASYAPGPALLRDHALVVAGPFRYVRHPIYSAVAALWVGTALGTVNWLLLLSWPFIALGVRKQALAEERMLRSKFGSRYDDYAKHTGRMFPKFPGAEAQRPAA
jgi:protein-S-isoprenylcysteine O-methyltransferase Ste14